VRSIIQFLAWKLAISRAVPATGNVQLTSGGGSLSRYPSGTVITVPRIVGHLTLGLTACPALLDPQIPTIRAAVQKRIKKYSHPKKKKRKKKGGKKRG
jgi:hypothetical protein